MKKSEEWEGHEEDDRVDFDIDYVPKAWRSNSPIRAIILFILRGESPETFPLRVEFNLNPDGKLIIADCNCVHPASKRQSGKPIL